MNNNKSNNTNINYLQILYILWSNSKIASFYLFYNKNPPEFDEQLAIQAINNGYIDYFCGRVIKANLLEFTGSNYELFKMYDRDNGLNKAKSVLLGKF